MSSDDGAPIPSSLLRWLETREDATSDDGSDEGFDDLYSPSARGGEIVIEDVGVQDIDSLDESSGYFRGACLERFNHTLFGRKVSRAIDLWCALFDRDNIIYVERHLARVQEIARKEGRLLGQEGGTSSVSAIWTVQRAEYLKQLDLSLLIPGGAPPPPPLGWEPVAKCDQCKTIITTSGYETRTEIGMLFCGVPCVNKNRLLSRLRAEPGQSVVCFNEECAETISLDGAGFSGAVAVGGKKNGGLYCPRCAAAKDKATKAKKKAKKAATDKATYAHRGRLRANRDAATKAKAKAKAKATYANRDAATKAKAKAKAKATKANRDAANLKAYGICGTVTRRGKCGHPALSMGGFCSVHRDIEKRKMKKRRKTKGPGS